MARIFEFLYLQHGYTDVFDNQINNVWADSFIRFAQDKGYILDSQWRQNYVLRSEQATDSLAL